LIVRTLSRVLQNRRWRPYLIGSLASLPVTILMIQVWKYDYGLAALSSLLVGFLLQFRVFWKTPTRQMLSTAVSLTIFFAAVIAA
jgi:hypothetical protein